LEIKNVAGNQKKFKIALKKFLYTYSFYTMEEYLSQIRKSILVNHELCTVSQDFYYSGTLI